MSVDPREADPDAVLAAAEGHATDGQVANPFDAAIEWCGRGIAWLVFVSMIISVTEVISRYVFDSPTSWVHETTVFLIAILFCVGGPVALARDKHIRVRILYDIASPRVRRWLDVLNGVISLGFCGGMSWAAYTLFWRSSHDPSGAWTVERSGTSWNPPFPTLTKGIILFALAIMTVQIVLHLIQAVIAVARDGEARS